jgi:predicted nucleotidyltransferase
VTERIEENVFEAVNSAGIDREDVKFVYLFGSYEEDTETARDIDVAISLDVENTAEAGYKLKGRVPDKVDLSVFENLPLQIRKEVFKGKLLYARDKSVYDTAYQTLKDYEWFKPLYETAVGA